MRSSMAFAAVCLICLLPGCVPGVGWLPDSSGFVYTTPQGELVAYDLATKQGRPLLKDPAAATTCWPAVSKGGKVALARLHGPDEKEA